MCTNLLCGRLSMPSPGSERHGCHLQSGLDLEGLAITTPSPAPEALQPLGPMLQRRFAQAIGVSFWMNEAVSRFKM